MCSGSRARKRQIGRYLAAQVMVTQCFGRAHRQSAEDEGIHHDAARFLYLRIRVCLASSLNERLQLGRGLKLGNCTHDENEQCARDVRLFSMLLNALHNRLDQLLVDERCNELATHEFI